MSNTSKDRNVKIELIRIIACIAVIWYHIRFLPWKSTGELSEMAVLFESICTICVMTFFLISGFFIYDRKNNIFVDWIHLLKNFFLKIFLPFILVAIFCIIFHDYLVTTATFYECIKNISVSNIVFSIKDSILTLSSDPLPGTAAHLWYVYAYLYILIAYPITRFILTKTPRYVSYILLTICLCVMIVNDYQSFYGDSIYYRFFEIIRKPIIYSAFGYILYHDVMKKCVDEKLRDNDKVIIINKIIFFTSIIVYLITFVLLFRTQVAYDLGVNNGYVFTSWLSTYSLVLTISFILIVYNINLEKFTNDSIKKGIYFISSKTFGIYLIHYPIIVKLSSIGFQYFFTRNVRLKIDYFIYFTFYGAFIFIISLLAVCAFDYIDKKLFGGLYGKKKRLS